MAEKLTKKQQNAFSRLTREDIYKGKKVYPEFYIDSQTGKLKFDYVGWAGGINSWGGNDFTEKLNNHLQKKRMRFEKRANEILKFKS